MPSRRRAAPQAAAAADCGTASKEEVSIESSAQLVGERDGPPPIEQLVEIGGWEAAAFSLPSYLFHLILTRAAVAQSSILYTHTHTHTHTHTDTHTP